MRLFLAPFRDFLTVILHRGPRNDFLFSIPIYFSYCFNLDFYFPFSLWTVNPFLFGLLFPFSFWTLISLLTFITLLFLFGLYFPFFFGLLFNFGHILDFFQNFLFRLLAAAGIFISFFIYTFTLQPTTSVRQWSHLTFHLDLLIWNLYWGAFTCLMFFGCFWPTYQP